MKREERVASILAAAARAFATGGYAATSMDDIAAEAGVTRLIIYRHFEGKQQLYEAVLNHTRDHLAEALRFTGTPEANMVQPLVAVARAEPHAFTLLFRHSAREPQFSGYAAEFTNAATAVAERALESVITEPALRRWTARILFRLTIEGILTSLDFDDRSSDAELADRLLRISGAVVGAVTT
ncbi:MAG: TetR/AcrR family transcriptional regulator [Micromonosporaceae bacterium]